MKKPWHGSIPKKCDLCNRPIKESFIDGQVKGESWAIMCTLCHATAGVGLGIGRGQKYVKKQNGFEKVE